MQRRQKPGCVSPVSTKARRRQHEKDAIVVIFFGCLFFIGALTASFATWLVPLIALFAYRRSPPQGTDSARLVSTQEKQPTLDILIPAHCEATSLPFTLRSVQAAVQNSGHLFQRVPRIIVALNAWSGSAAEIASQGSDLTIEVPQKGKWHALQELVKHTDADWVGFVDAGISWPVSLLSELQSDFTDIALIGLNPRYCQQRQERSQNILWSFEAILKNLENRVGGPISVHGATVFYRRAELVETFKMLAPHMYLNDDVAIPFCLRSLCPDRKIKYVTTSVVTEGERLVGTAQFGRRRRLLIGNLQWIRNLVKDVFRRSPFIAFLAVRRIMRMAWGWWLSLCFIGLSGLAVTRFFPEALSASMIAPWLTALFLVFLLAILTLSAAVLMPFRGLSEAFAISLLSPIYLFAARPKETQWK
jgi:cellulose synthase/poly-beta-1,6-N-acetylglucosamine synthase-like glycosyltransferase